MQPYQLTFLLLSSLILLGISRRSLGDPHHHGFFRFFAWEIFIVQVTIHLPVWFKNPLSWYQMISWLLLMLSILVVCAGFYYLRSYGGSGMRKAESLNYDIENTTELVNKGIYAYIRHPIYSSLIFGALGVFFKFPSFNGGFLALVVIGLVYLTAKVEEKENLRTFGLEYQNYIKTTKMFFPGLF